MKPDLHPKYEETTYVCSCGNTFTSRSTHGGTLRIELCNKCHPFYTGQQKFVDTGGRVQRFTDKFGGAATATLEKERAAAEAHRAAAEAAEAEKRRQREAKAAAKAARAAEFEHGKAARVVETEPAEAAAAGNDSVGSVAPDAPSAEPEQDVAAEAVAAEATPAE
ncbi:MAG: 50S ribosomal protein L31 [Actinomycetia bacterium]|nr:50S ribosomal protein L31 [Actinomycetes bacterium]